MKFQSLCSLGIILVGRGFKIKFATLSRNFVPHKAFIPRTRSKLYYLRNHHNHNFTAKMCRISAKFPQHWIPSPKYLKGNCYLRSPRSRCQSRIWRTWGCSGQSRTSTRQSRRSAGCSCPARRCCPGSRHLRHTSRSWGCIADYHT